VRFARTEGENDVNEKSTIQVKVLVDGKERYGQTRVRSWLVRLTDSQNELELAIRAVESLLEKMKEELEDSKVPRSGAV
jgi:hypothetical protein